MEDGGPPLPGYSCANLRKICQDVEEGWHPTEPTINLSNGRTAAFMRIRTQNEGEIEIRLSLLKDFDTACGDLASYVSSSCYPVDKLFPKSSSGPREIKLQTPVDASHPAILWVYHNIFIILELSMLNHRDCPQEDLEPFTAFAEKVFQSIRDGFKPLDETTVPEVVPKEIKSFPSSIELGAMFDVDVVTDVTYLDDVECDNSVSSSSALPRYH